MQNAHAGPALRFHGGVLRINDAQAIDDEAIVVNASRRGTNRGGPHALVVLRHRRLGEGHRFETQQHASRVMADWIRFYNTPRPHEALGMKTSARAYELAARPVPRWVITDHRRQDEDGGEGAGAATDDGDAPPCFHEGECCGLPDSAACSGYDCIFCHSEGVADGARRRQAVVVQNGNFVKLPVMKVQVFANLAMPWAVASE